MEKLYWMNGIKFVGLLKKHGYAWQGGGKVGSGTSIMEQIIKDAYAYVIAVNHVKKTLGIYPLEIYAPGSPTADAEKYKKVVDRCGNFADLENDLMSIGVGGEITC